MGAMRDLDIAQHGKSRLLSSHGMTAELMCSKECIRGCMEGMQQPRRLGLALCAARHRACWVPLKRLPGTLHAGSQVVIPFNG